jgi:hypothetical protein
MGKAFKVPKQVIAQIRFDLRNAGTINRSETGNAFGRGHCQQQQRIRNQLVPRDTEMKVIRPADPAERIRCRWSEGTQIVPTT